MRRLRLWVCPCCRAAWSRGRKDQNPLRCSSCSVLMKAARTFPARRKRLCEHERTRTQVRTFKERYWTKPRMRGMHVLTSNRELRRLWNDVRRAKLRPALIRRGQKFLAALVTHIRSDQKIDGSTVVGWTKTLGRDGQVQKHAGGMGGVPTVKADTTLYDHGRFTVHLLRGINEVAINTANPNTERFSEPMDALRGTLIHEILHVIDRETSVDEEHHGHYWKLRLAFIERMFPPQRKRP